MDDYESERQRMVALHKYRLSLILDPPLDSGMPFHEAISKRKAEVDATLEYQRRQARELRAKYAPRPIVVEVAQTSRPKPSPPKEKQAPPPPPPVPLPKIPLNRQLGPVPEVPCKNPFRDPGRKERPAENPVARVAANVQASKRKVATKKAVNHIKRMVKKAKAAGFTVPPRPEPQVDPMAWMDEISDSE